MKQKTSIFLSGLAVGLRVLVLAAVLLMTDLQESVKGIFSAVPEALEAHTVPWPAIIQAGAFLVVAVVILMVLLSRPNRRGTKTLTVAAAAAYGVLGALVFPALSLVFTQQLARQEGAVALASYSALSSAISLVTPFLSTPALILSLLSLGGAYGKSFREPDMM